MGDLSDAGGQEEGGHAAPAEVLFTQEYYELIRAALAPGGVFAMYAGIMYDVEWSFLHEYTARTRHGTHEAKDSAICQK